MIFNHSTSSTGTTATPKAATRHGWVTSVVLAGCLAACISVFTSGEVASAASQGNNNRASCDPNTGTIWHTVEAFPAIGETVTLNSYLRNESTGQTFSFWMYGNPYASSAAALNTVTWTGMPKGNYSVWYRWYSSTWAYGPWIQVTDLTTYGARVQTGWINSTRGWCGI